jgi:hypothetical protein
MSAGSRSRAAQAADFDPIDLFERFDGYASVRNLLRGLADERGEWAGYPLPMDGHRLVVEPSYPRAAALMSIGAPTPAEQAEEGKYKLRNKFYSMHRRADILVWEEDGKLDWGISGSPVQTAMLLDTLGASDAWGIEQESAAIHTLGGMVRHRQFKQYMLTGMFMERSRRSGISYLFRRLRPTLAISTRGERTKTLCALCLHPIGYYAGSWSGAMCPTDDVIAHLALMRGDEHMFWRRANQHPAWRPEAGL